MPVSETTLDKFKVWLVEERKLQESTGNTYRYRIRWMEENLSKTGLPFKTLDAAFKEDHFESLIERLREIRSDAQKHGANHHEYTRETSSTYHDISDAITKLNAYREFLLHITTRPTL